MTLDERIKAQADSARLDLMPESDKRNKRERVVEVVADIKEVVANTTLRMKISRLAKTIRELNVEESQIRAQKKPLVEAMKNYLDTLGEKKLKFMVGSDIRVSLYPMSRSRIDSAKLLALNVPPSTIHAATVTSYSSNLKISGIKESEGEEDGED